VTVERLTDEWNVVEFVTEKGKLSFVLPSEGPSDGSDDEPLQHREIRSAIETAVSVATSFLAQAAIEPAGNGVSDGNISVRRGSNLH
jgi:hypothetical protein